MKNRIICVLTALVLLAPVAASAQDTDSDGVLDAIDNCSLVPNANQRDTDGDLIGNFCDADISGPVNVDDCFVNFFDLLIMRSNFFLTGDLDTDMNGDGFTNFLDLRLMRNSFFGPPGPSAAGCN